MPCASTNTGKKRARSSSPGIATSPKERPTVISYAELKRRIRSQRPSSPFQQCHPEVKRMIASRLDVVSSTCLGLTCRALYDVHRKLHGCVPLSACDGSTCPIAGAGRVWNPEWDNWQPALPLRYYIEGWMLGGGYCWPSEDSFCLARCGWRWERRFKRIPGWKTEMERRMEGKGKGKFGVTERTMMGTARAQMISSKRFYGK
ncbi:hypothetical protein B0O99DRAFT_207488 [Bisporella sp. PMI_857]|nr:hypothetical protein B0O99DRAFT_207488 [Bisporella sp. PMI_857]